MRDWSFNAYYKQCNKQGTRILLSIHCLDCTKLKITPAVVVGVSKRKDCRSSLWPHKNIFGLTSVVCKLLETLIRDLVKQNLINTSQHGFLKQGHV